MGSLIFFVGMLISLALLMYSKFFQINMMRVIFKTLTSLLFLGVAHYSRKECSKNKSSVYYKLMFLGLTFSLFGDVFLEGGTDGLLFVLGVASFASAHISYTVAFFQFGKLSKLNIIWTIIFAIPLLWLVLGTDWFTLGALKPLIAGYAVLISFMAAKSLTLWKYRNENRYFVYITITGALFFLISDTILLFALFGDESLRKLEIVNNFIYYIGQGLFGLSFRRELLVQKGK